METPTFKQLLMRDVHQVFLNPEEYGERHRVNGKVMTIVQIGRASCRERVY